jgi:hypothetical protein
MRRLQNVLVISIVLFFFGCAATNQARTVERLGFLKDLYPIPRVALIPPHTYTKFMLDPILIFRGPESNMHGIPQDQAQLMADTFYALIKDYEMVDKPGPRTLRTQIAITHLEQSWPILDDVVSGIPAPLNALAAGSLLKTVATGKPAFTGEAMIEAKVSDAQTGEVLRAAVDRRVGTQNSTLTRLIHGPTSMNHYGTGQKMADTSYA